MSKSLDACQVGRIKQWLFHTDVLSSFWFEAVKMNNMMCIMCFWAIQTEKAKASMLKHFGCVEMFFLPCITAQEALMGSAYVACQTGRKIAGQGNGNANVDNCGRTSAKRCDAGAIWHLLMRLCDDGLVWNGFLTRLRAALSRLTDSVSWERLMVFPMYTRPHVRFSIQTACVVLQEWLQSIAMLLVVFMVIETVGVIYGSEGSFIMFYAT